MKYFSMLAVVAVALTGCTVTPGAGPQTGLNGLAAVNKVAPEKAIVLNVSSEIMPIIGKARSRTGFGRLRGSGASVETQIGSGDVIGVTIFEAGAGGLFIPADAGSRQGNFVALPDQQVDKNGNISVPYAGSIHVVGVSPTEIQRIIEQRLANRAIEPQVVITLKSQTSGQVSVLGDVNAASKFQLSARSETVLDAIARAGGPRYPGYETMVTLDRGNKKVTTSFQSIMQDPANNVHLAPGDIVYLYREPQTFTAFGATGANGRFDFDNDTMTLTDALAKAGGLLDSRANPGSVLIYRMESREVAKALDLDITAWPTGPIPIIYQFNLRDPGGFFLASSFQITNRDLIYIGNAAAVEFLKLVNVVGTAATATQVARESVR